MPTQVLVKTRLCAFFARRECTQGSSCPFAHGEHELRTVPNLTKTRLCQEYRQTGKCSAERSCQFAHSREELRSTANVWKTKICKFFATTGTCSLGAGCRFAHGLDELRTADYINPNREDSLSALFNNPPDTPTSSGDDDASLVSTDIAAGDPPEGGSLMQLWNSGRRLSAVAAELQKLFFHSV